jgi:hypothetical protein
LKAQLTNVKENFMADFSTNQVNNIKGNGITTNTGPDLNGITVPTLLGKRGAMPEPTVTNDSAKPSPESLTAPLVAPAPASLATPSPSPESLATPVAVPAPAPAPVTVAEGGSPVDPALLAAINAAVDKKMGPVEGQVAHIQQEVDQIVANSPIASTGVGSTDGANTAMNNVAAPSPTINTLPTIAPVPTLTPVPAPPPAPAAPWFEKPIDSKSTDPAPSSGKSAETVATLKSGIKEANNELDHLNDDIGGAKGNSKVKKEIVALKNELSELREKIAEAKKELKALKAGDAKSGSDEYLVEVDDKKPAKTASKKDDAYDVLGLAPDSKKAGSKTASRSSEVKPESGRFSQKVDPNNVFTGQDGSKFVLNDKFLRDVEKFRKTGQMDFGSGGAGSNFLDDWKYAANVSKYAMGGPGYIASAIASGDTSMVHRLGSDDALYSSDKAGAKIALGSSPSASQVEFDSEKNMISVKQSNGEKLQIAKNDEGKWIATSYNRNGDKVNSQELKGDTAIQIPTGNGNETGLLRLQIDGNNQLKAAGVGVGGQTYLAEAGDNGKFSYRPVAQELSSAANSVFAFNGASDFKPIRSSYDAYDTASRNPANILAGGTNPIAKYGQLNA